MTLSERLIKSELLKQIEQCEQKAHRLGMHVTGYSLNRAKNAAGWEAAGNVEQAAKAARNEVA